MKGAGSVLVGIITIFLLLGPFQPAITQGIHGWRTHNTTESFIVATGGGATTANVTLGHDLFQAATGEVIAVSSNITESPAVTGYTESNKHLELASLNAATSRTIAVNYYAETDDTVMRALGPFLSVLIFGGCVTAILWGMWSSIKGKR